MDGCAIWLHITYNMPFGVKQFVKLPSKTLATILRVGEGSIWLEFVSIASSVGKILKEKLGVL